MPEYLPQCSTVINNKTVVWLHLIIITHLATECRKPVCFFPALNGLNGHVLHSWLEMDM